MRSALFQAVSCNGDGFLIHAQLPIVNDQFLSLFDVKVKFVLSASVHGQINFLPLLCLLIIFSL